MEAASEEKNKVKRMRITEDNLSGLWDNSKLTSSRIIQVPENNRERKDMIIFFKRL